MQCLQRLLAMICGALICLHAGADTAQARRVALVIGNAEYNVGPLQNPGNDAGAVAEAFEKQLKFDKVILKRNLGAEAFRAALREIGREVRGVDFGVVFFAGHGVEIAGRNYLIPTDATLAAARDIELEAIALDTVLGQLEGARKLKLVILDACRNNPFSIADARRTVTRGLARIEPEGNTLVAYAAKDGTTADDGWGQHSPFTEALLKRIATPGLDVRRLFGYVSDDVMAATNHVQEPYLYGRMGGEEIFLHPQPVQEARPLVASQLQPSQAALEWARVDKASIAELETFRRRHPSSPEAEYALARIEQLKLQVALALPPAPRQEPPPAAYLTPQPSVAPQGFEAAAGAFSRSRAAVPLSAAEERALRPGDSSRECEFCPGMVVVPAGSFVMGSPSGEAGRDADEGPQRQVTIAKPFAAGKFEVTFAEWDLCVSSGGCQHRPGDEGWGRGKRPVINVSWDDITREYLPWLSRKTGAAYRLLTEAEWEYAARAGAPTPFWWGSSTPDGRANYRTPVSPTQPKTVPVDSFATNPWGLYNVHGNVYEWVQECWNANYNGAPADGSTWTSGNCAFRVIRGGCFCTNNPEAIRSAHRGRHETNHRHDWIGFRVARTLAGAF